MTSKGEHERQVFLEFAEAARLGVDADSISACEPPQPDIRCLVNGTPTYFELARLLNKAMQKLRLKAMRQAPVPFALDPSVQLPEREVLSAKLRKHYECGDIPVELILYYDNENWLRGDVPLFWEDFPWHAEHVMVPLIRKTPEIFRRTWVFERHRRSVLWTHPTGAIPSNERCS